MFEVEQAPDKETYKYYSTQRPIDMGTYPKSYFNRPVHMDIYFNRQQVQGEAFQAWGAITYAQPLTEQEMRDYELRPSRENLDIRRQMDAQAQVVGKWEDAHHAPEQKRLTWFYPDFGSYVVKEYVTPEQLSIRARGVERQAAAKAHKQEKGKQPIAEQLKAAQREAQEHQGPEAQKRKPPTGRALGGARMEKQREQDRADLEVKRLCGVFGSPQPPEEEKPLDKVKEPPRPYRSREREER